MENQYEIDVWASAKVRFSGKSSTTISIVFGYRFSGAFFASIGSILGTLGAQGIQNDTPNHPSGATLEPISFSEHTFGAVPRTQMLDFLVDFRRSVVPC